jgi:hypothetical protein
MLTHKFAGNLGRATPLVMPRKPKAKQEHPGPLRVSDPEAYRESLG